LQRLAGLLQFGQFDGGQDCWLYQHGMVLAAKLDGKVELVEPPADAEIGSRVTLDDGNVQANA
jgi:hypothetical protein